MTSYLRELLVIVRIKVLSAMDSTLLLITSMSISISSLMLSTFITYNLMKKPGWYPSTSILINYVCTLNIKVTF